MPATVETAAPRSALSLSEAHLALWNAVKLGASLVLTWSVALGVRALLPRYLGPAGFGEYSFAEAVAATFFVFATLGIETYVHKSIPVRPEHASEFFGGLLALRVVLGGGLIALMCAGLAVTGRAHVVVVTALLFGLGQLAYVNNCTFVSMLNARGRVDGMSVVNVAAKAGWGLCIVLAVLGRAGLPMLAGAFIAGEAVRGAALFRLCRRHLDLRLRFDRAQLELALRRSAPFFVTSLALAIYARFDLMMLSYLSAPAEVGWYAAASQVANLGLVLAPLVSGVCLPMFSRARARGEDELGLCIRRSLEVVLLLAIPVSLAIWVGADVWIRLLGGPGFEPAARSLRMMAPMFLLTYVAMLGSSFLNLVNHAWTVTRACLFGIVANTVLNFTLIRYAGPHLGVAGQSVGAAAAGVITEAFVCAILLSVIGKRLFDARLFGAVAKTLAITAAVIALDALLQRLGPARLIADAAAYVVLSLVTGAVRVDEVRTVARTVKQR